MFGNRKLKREIEVLTCDIRQLNGLVKAYEKEIAELNDIRLKALTARNEAEKKSRESEAENKRLLKLTRMQNEADLMFSAVKIIKELLSEKKLKDVSVKRDDLSALISAYSANQPQQGYASGLNNLMGSASAWWGGK